MFDLKNLTDRHFQIESYTDRTLVLIIQDSFMSTWEVKIIFTGVIYISIPTAGNLESIEECDPSGEFMRDLAEEEASSFVKLIIDGEDFYIGYKSYSLSAA